MDKVFGLLGLARRAGKVICGEKPSKDAVKFGRACVVVIASDASENTKKNITDSCRYYNIPYYIYGTKDELGHAVGNEFNACVTVSDVGFANSIEKCLQANINGGD